MLQPQQHRHQHAQRRMGYFDLYPEHRPLHLNQDDDEELLEINVRAPVQNEVDPPRRSDVTTESVYPSSGNNHSPPASPKTAAAPDSRLQRLLETTTLPLKSPQQQPASTPSPLTPTQTPAQMQTYSPRDLQRQQEVRDWLSGKPGATAGALIEMYRDRERQATTGGTSGATGADGVSPGKISNISVHHR